MLEFWSYTAAGVLILLGALAVNSTWVERHKVAFGFLLATAGFIDLWAAHEADERADNAIEELKIAASEQKRLAEINAQLQREILALSKENRQLSTETLRTALGDPDNPPYLFLFNLDLNASPIQANLYLMNSSRRYAARDVNASLRLDGITVTTEAESVPPNSRVPAATPNKVGLPSTIVYVPQLAKVGSRITFVAVIASSAGSFSQVTALVRSSQTEVSQAIRVYRTADRSKIIFSRTDTGFPTDFAWPKVQIF